MSAKQLFRLPVLLTTAFLCACPLPGSRGTGLPEHGYSSDVVAEAGRGLYDLVRLMDEYARPAGTLPVTLEPVLSQYRLRATDPWGTQLRYSPTGLRYELRSAGPDTTFGTADDVVAAAQLGRNLPCEMRDQHRVWRGEDLAPPCNADGPVVILPICSELMQIEPGQEVVPGGARDSLLAMGRKLVIFARRLDGAGRERGGLPPTLRVPGSNRFPDGWGLLDLWGNRVRYRPTADNFELRSAGMDGALDTKDDIVVVAQLGRTIPCQFQTENGIEACTEPAPPCPEGPL